MKKLLEFILGVLLLYNGFTANNINIYGKVIYIACGIIMIFVPFTKPRPKRDDDSTQSASFTPVNTYHDDFPDSTVVKPVTHPYTKYVVFDIETTGLDIKSSEIIQLAGIRVVDGVITDKYCTLVHPIGAIHPEATRVNGIKESDVASAPSLHDVLIDFWNFVGSDMLVGYNIAKFDLPILKRDLLSELDIEPHNEFIDVYKMAQRAELPTKNLKLTTVAVHFGIHIAGAHDALIDCEITNSCFEALLTKTMPNVEIADKVPTPIYKRPAEEDPEISAQLLSSIMSTCDDFTIDGKGICLSGKFDIGDISFVTDQIVEHGGIIKSTISSKVDYLIVGNRKNDRWKNGMYGTKLIKANKLNDAGGHITIVSENVLRDFLDL